MPLLNSRGKRCSFAARRRSVLSATLVAGLVAGILVDAPAAQAANGFVPGQFISKMYSEALGRLPDQAGWKGEVANFGAQGCMAATLANTGRQIYGSTEFAGLEYDNEAKLLTLYRGALNREPDTAGMANWRNQLAGGMTWRTVVDKFFTSDEFRRLVPKICSGAKDSSATSYSFGQERPIALPTTGAGFTGTEDQLQAKLTAAGPSRGTVELAQRALVFLTRLPVS